MGEVSGSQEQSIYRKWKMEHGFQPIGSMYGIYGNIYRQIYPLYVSIYTRTMDPMGNGTWIFVKSNGTWNMEMDIADLSILSSRKVQEKGNAVGYTSPRISKY